MVINMQNRRKKCMTYVLLCVMRMCDGERCGGGEGGFGDMKPF